ncbi:MAG: hypothetical protein ACHQ4H_10600 [Ktedonobacterales bacterium]
MTRNYDGSQDEQERADADEIISDASTAARLDAELEGTGEPRAEQSADELAPRRRSRKPSGTKSRAPQLDAGEAIVALPRRKSLTDEVTDLESQGFTEDEAVRLISVSERLAHSGEARESEETMRRLHFTRWLVEHGVLDEFSA